MSDNQLVLQAAARILAMDYPNDLTEEERLERFNEDAAFCAAFIEDIWAKDKSPGERHDAMRRALGL